MGFKTGFLLPKPPVIACHQVSGSKSSEVPLTLHSILHSPSSYSFIALNLGSLNTAVRDGWKSVVKRKSSNTLVQPLYIIFPTDWNIFLNYAQLFFLPKISFKAAEAAVNFLSLMFHRTCCVFTFCALLGMAGSTSC